jgi:hypothetical protein
MSESTAPLKYAERRAAGRRATSALLVCCRTVPAKASDSWTARAVDVSAVGIALLGRRRVVPGTVVAARPLGTPGEEAALPHARVVRVLQGEGGLRLLGCRFLGTLSDGQLDALK